MAAEENKVKIVVTKTVTEVYLAKLTDEQFKDDNYEVTEEDLEERIKNNNAVKVEALTEEEIDDIYIEEL